MLKRMSSSDANEDTDDCRVCAEDMLLRGTAALNGALEINTAFEGLAPVEFRTGVLGRRASFPRLYADAGMVGGPIVPGAGA